MTVRVAGEIDASVTDELLQVIDEVIEQGVRHLTLDLSGVEFVDSSGLAAFVITQRNVQRVDGDVTLVNIQAPVWKVLETTGLGQILAPGEHKARCAPRS